MKILRLAATFTLGLFASLPVFALEINYDIDRNSALLECDQLNYHGKKSEAQNCYTDLLDLDDLHIRAEATWALGNTREANQLFRAAAKANENNPAIKTRWGRLYSITHQTSDAMTLFKEALQIDADYLPAKLAIIEATSRRFEGQVRIQLLEILKEHPDSLEAHLLMARLELELKDTAVARKYLINAQKLAEKTQLPMLEIYALQASADLLDGKTDSEATKKSLDLNPNYGDIYAIPAHFYIITYRYREAVEQYRLAVGIEPEHWSAHSALGINLLRINKVDEARQHLEIAYKGDPFDTATVNTLRLLDTLEDLQLVHIEVDYSQAADEDSGEIQLHKASVILRLDKKEAQVLKPYVTEIVSQAIKTLSERYDFHLQQPLIVELYPNHDDFAVRTVSTPGVGLLGVTFGYLLAMDSPRALPEGDFHWASVLWHELVHVFTLEASDHLLPRWFGEGLSVYEEWNTGPLPGKQLPISVFKAMRDDTFLPVAELDQGFIRPTYRGQVNISYMQAGLICDFIAQQWGHDALQNLLRQFATGADTKSAIRTVLKMETTAFDESFRKSLNTQYARVMDKLELFQEKLNIATEYAKRQDWSKVHEPAREAIEILPEYTGPGNAYLPLANALKAEGETEKTHDLYRAWLQKGGHHPVILRSIADEFSAHGHKDDAINVLTALNLVAPYSLKYHGKLADLHLSKQQAQQALREYDVMLSLEPLDTAPIYLGKAKAYRLLDNFADSRRQALYSLEQAPFYREAQKFLIDLIDGDAS